MAIEAGKYAIAGVGITKQGKLPDHTTRQVAAWAIKDALEDAGLEPQDIDGYIYGHQDPAVLDLRYLGLRPKFSWYMQTGGATASATVIAACGAIEAGIAETVLLMGCHRPYSTRARIGSHGYGIGRAWGLVSPVASHAFHATRHMAVYGTTFDQLGTVAVVERDYACQRPDAIEYGNPITLQDHLDSPMICYPLRRLDCTRDTDGGVALVVTTTERARDLKAPPVTIEGLGAGHNIRRWDDKSVYLGLDCASARDSAFRMAGISIDDVDVFECYDAFTINVIMQLEGYGFCKEGEGGAFVMDGQTRLDGRIPTNTGGGQLSGWYVMGYTALTEGILQMRRQAGATQVVDAEIALVTGHGANAGVQNTWAHGCIVFGRKSS